MSFQTVGVAIPSLVGQAYISILGATSWLLTEGTRSIAFLVVYTFSVLLFNIPLPTTKSTCYLPKLKTLDPSQHFTVALQL